MVLEQDVELRIIGDKEFVSDIYSCIENQEDDYEVILNEVNKDQSSFEFGLVEVAALVTIIQGAVFLGDFVYKLLDSLKRSKSKSIVLQTPIKRVEINYSEDLTDKELMKILKQMVSMK